MSTRCINEVHAGTRDNPACSTCRCDPSAPDWGRGKRVCVACGRWMRIEARAMCTRCYMNWLNLRDEMNDARDDNRAIEMEALGVGARTEGSA